MKDLRKRFNRFCYKHRGKGIPNLMLYICLGNALVYLMTVTTNNYALYDLLSFDRTSILQGQIWRLVTFPFTVYYGNILLGLISLVCYYSLGRAMENHWGTFKFNLFYLCGMVMMDIFCLIFGGQASASYLNLSLFLSYATLYPNTQFLFLYIIPVKAWIFALMDLALVLWGLIVYPWPENLFSVISLANYFLFFGKDVLNVIPMSWRVNCARLFRRFPGKKRSQAKAKTIPFPTAGSYEASNATPKAPYTHRCTICGRTDLSHPDLEFRYCSRCKGYYCYCQDHIGNHEHIT